MRVRKFMHELYWIIANVIFRWIVVAVVRRSATRNLKLIEKDEPVFANKRKIIYEDFGSLLLYIFSASFSTARQDIMHTKVTHTSATACEHYIYLIIHDQMFQLKGARRMYIYV